MKTLFKYNRFYFKTLILFLLILVGLKVLISDISLTFIGAYIGAFIGFYSVNLLEFSFQDNGMSFLFTLPINKEQYVRNNYFTILISIILIGVSSLVLNVFNNLDNNLVSVLYLVSMPLVITGINFPVKLYAGPGFSAAFGFSGFITMILVMLFVPLSIFLADNLNLAFIIFSLASICFIVSYFVSLNIIAKKEF